MTRTESLLVLLASVLMFALGFSVTINVMMSRDLGDLETRQDGLATVQEELDQAISFLDPYRGESLQAAKRNFETDMTRFQNEAMDGIYPAGQAFDEAILPSLSKIYIASKLGFIDKDEALSLITWAKLFIMQWPHTFAESDTIVQGFYMELQLDISDDSEEDDPEEPAIDNRQQVRRLNPAVFFYP